MSFEAAFQRVVMVEGGYSNHPSDTGGETQFGITKAVARANGYAGEMREMPLATAKTIYRRQYWDTLRLDEIDQLSQKVADELFDTGVNMGVGVAGRFLQRALSAMNRQQRDYPDVPVDGVVGPMTVHSLRAFISRRGRDGEPVMLRALNAQQGVRYLEISENRPANEDFTFGWFKNRVA